MLHSAHIWEVHFTTNFNYIEAIYRILKNELILKFNDLKAIYSKAIMIKN